MVSPRNCRDTQSAPPLSEIGQRFRRSAKGHVVGDFQGAKCDQARTADAVEKAQVIVALVGTVLLGVAGGADYELQRQGHVQKGRRLPRLHQRVGSVVGFQKGGPFRIAAKPGVGKPRRRDADGAYDLQRTFMREREQTFDRAKAVPNQADARADSLFQEIDPCGEVVPAIIDGSYAAPRRRPPLAVTALLMPSCPRVLTRRTAQ